jgi:nucleotide-binding universal stress UspA family protein
MAHLFKAKVFLLHAIEAEVYAMLPESALVMEIEPPQEHVVERLNSVAEDIVKKYDIELSTLTVNGKPAKGIAAAVKENGIDIVIMGTHGAGGFEEFFVGSNTHRVVTLAPCPVLSIQKFAKKVGFSNIIMPIDSTLHSRQKINNVIALATAYESNVHILGLLEKDNEEADEKKFKIKLDSVEDRLIHANIPFTKKLVRGDNLAVEAMNYSKEVKGDLIVIMSDHESKLTGIFMGAYAQQIVNHSRIPVLSIKPEETTIETFDLTGGTGVII